MKRITSLMLGLIVIALGLLYTSANIVSEGEQGILLCHDKIVMAQNKPVILPSGLYWISPINESLQIYDVRLLNFTTDNLQFSTSDKQSLSLSVWAQWKIVDVAKYYEFSQTDATKLQNVLQQTLAADLQAALAKQTLLGYLAQPGIPDSVLLDLNKLTQAYGVSVTALGINSLSLPQAVVDNVHTAMQTHLNTLYATLNAQAKQNVELIHADADAQAQVIIAAANSQVSKIRAAADAKAAQIYNTAYQASPQFYLFYRSMQAYKAVFAGQHSLIVLRPQGDFFKYFNSFTAAQTSKP